MQSHDTEEQYEYNQKILKLAQEAQTPFIITTDSHAATQEDLKYQGYHVQIAHDDETASEIYSGCYMQSDQEIHRIMDKQIGKENVDLALQETDRIADMIDVVNMPFQSPQLPTYPLPDGYQDNAEMLRDLCMKGWKVRGFDKMPEADQKIRKDRMEYELGVIHQMGFDGYFLIVWDFVNYAKANNIIVGDGRGSGGGSIVPITGFANSVVSPALEYNREGVFFGLCAKMVVIAGPIIVFGVVSGVVVGIVACLV